MVAYFLGHPVFWDKSPLNSTTNRDVVACRRMMWHYEIIAAERATR